MEEGFDPADRPRAGDRGSLLAMTGGLTPAAPMREKSATTGICAPCWAVG